MMKANKEFKKLILKKAKIKFGTSEDNIKLGNMGTWAMLFGNVNWYIPELDMEVKGTCGNFCKGCFDEVTPKCSDCYVVKSYIKYTQKNADGSVGDIIKNACSVKLGHAYRTIAMTMFRTDLLLSLDKQLTNKEKGNDDKYDIRIDESGEITCEKDLSFWCELARRHPRGTFYLYTKNYKAVRKVLGFIPGNLIINISIWHKCGIKEYIEFAEYPQIRAFCTVDEEWTREKYANKGIEIDSMCGAYDEKGRMNHNVTCDKCRKCMNTNTKCTGCYKH